MGVHATDLLDPGVANPEIGCLGHGLVGWPGGARGRGADQRWRAAASVASVTSIDEDDVGKDR